MTLKRYPLVINVNVNEMRVASAQCVRWTVKDAIIAVNELTF